MNKKYILLSFLCALLFNYAFAQRNSFSVDPLTGTGSMTIPIYRINSGEVSVPISVSYTPGVKPKDIEGTAGMGWNVQAGGSVSRVVRGLPDDISKDDSAQTRLGWMSKANAAASSISGFNIANNGSTCANETTDISYINAHFPYTSDTEPDIFYVNAPGLSCQLVYNRADSSFKPIGYQDLVIAFTKTGSGNNPNFITSFTITNDKGIKYVFAAPESDREVTTQGSHGSANFFTNKYLQYIHGITYNDSWNLTQVTDPNGSGAKFVYTTQPARASADSIGLYVGPSPIYNLQYYISQSVTPQRIAGIETTNAYYTQGYLSFNWTTVSGTGQTIITSITGADLNYQFNYSSVNYTLKNYHRSFLRSVIDNPTTGCSSPVNYQFSYIGETGGTTPLPDSSSTLRDYWGYYAATASSSTLIPSLYVNAFTTAYQRYLIDGSAARGSMYNDSLINGNRRADPAVIATGSLNKISYAQGGNTNIIYEPNDYYDVSSSSVVKGGGIRVKQIIDSVGNGSTNNIIRNYSYVNPTTGLSSGKPVTLPQFAFTIPYGGSATGHLLWVNATALSAYDLSQEDKSIMYAYARVSQTGAGSTLYQYNIPATNWDLSASPSCSGCGVEWFPTIDFTGRNNCTSTYGPIANESYAYPFIPNPNYDFERGLPVKVESFNDAGTEVSESDYTYLRAFTPSIDTAFKYELNNTGLLNTYMYNKYTVFYHTSELTATVISKVFDSPTLTVVRLDTTTYTYGSSHHKLVTQITASNSDKSVLTTKMNYTKDYTAAAGTNANVTAIYNLQRENVNVPVESYQQVTRSGTTNTTSASLTLFKSVKPGSDTLYLPATQLKLVQPNGITNFAPYSISGQTSTNDSRYFTVANYDTYDNTGFPVTVDDNYKNIGTTVINHYAGKPIAVFKNAAYAEVAFSDFDTDLAAPLTCNFSISGSQAFTPTTSHAGRAYGLGTTQTISKTVTKNAIASNYIFSIWVNATTAGTLTITLNTTPYTISFAGNSTWTYYEKKMPLTGMPSSLPVSVTSSQQIAIDDILFYPDVSEVSTATYNSITNVKMAETNTNGVSAYYQYDQWKRLTYVLDQDKNIVKKNTYLLPADIKAFNSANIALPASPTVGTAANFSISGLDSCSASGAKVTWHFGDTTTLTTSILATASHTFHSAGNKAVTASISSPLFGNFTLGPDTINVYQTPIHVTYTNTTYSNGDITSATFTNLGTGPNYTFTGATLRDTYIVPGKYSITLVLSGATHYVTGSGPTGPGYGTIILNGSCFYTCSTYLATNTYNYTADLSNCTTLAIGVAQINTCP